MPAALLRYGPTLIAAAAVLLVLWLAYSWAWDRGYAARDSQLRAETAEMQARLDASAEAMAKQAEALEHLRADRADLERRLADEAANDPLAGRRGLGADSLRRLDRIR